MMAIASSFGWQFQVLDDDWSIPPSAVLKHDGKNPKITGSLGLKGIQLKPPAGPESVDFFFDSKGYLLSPMNVILLQEGVLGPDDAWVSVKTQFLPTEIHVMIVGLLKYIKEHHIPNLEVQDGGEYWETGDCRVLEEKKRLIQERIEYLSGALSSENLGGLSADEIASRIERLVHAEGMESKDIH